MTNTKKKSVTNPNQPSLFDVLRQEQTERQQTRPGRLNIRPQFEAALRAALKGAGKSRETVADEMTELLGVEIEITAATIGNWVSESHPHRIPPEYITAFCIATGCNEPLRILAEPAGLFTLQGPDALRAEKQREIDEIHKRQKKVRDMDVLIGVLEGKR